MLVGHYTKEDVDNTNYYVSFDTIRKKKLRRNWSEEIHGAVILSPLFFLFFVQWYSQGTGKKKRKKKKLLPKTNRYTPGHLGTGVHNFGTQVHVLHQDVSQRN